MKTTDLVLDIEASDEWSEADSVKIYRAQELVEYINGGAELYFAYNFMEACIKNYHNGTGDTLIVEVYEMDKSENAYGIYSFDPEGEHPSIGQEATYANGLLKFWKDRFFVRIFSPSGEKKLRAEIFIFGRRIAEIVPNDGKKPSILLMIPNDQLVSDNPHYFHTNISLNNFYYLSDANILHLNEQTEAVTYEYEMGSQSLRVIFIQYLKQKTCQIAYGNFMKSYFFDHVDSDSALLESSEFIGEVEQGKHTGIRLSGNFLTLVFEADDKDSCKKMLDLQTALLGN